MQKAAHPDGALLLLQRETWEQIVKWMRIGVKQRGCEGAGQARDRQTEGDWDQAWREDAGMIVEREQNSQPDALKAEMLASDGTVTLYAVWAEKDFVSMTFDAGEGSFADDSRRRLRASVPVIY